MSTGPIPLLTPANLSFTPGSPDFTDFVASQLGNNGTDSDGFDTLLSDTIALQGEAETLLTSFDGSLTDAGTTLAGLAAFDPASDQAGLVSTAAAIDAALNDYNQQLPPQPNAGSGSGSGTGAGCKPGTVINGVTIGKPDPKPVPTIPNIPNLDYHEVFNAMCVNDPKQDVIINTWTVSTDGTHWSSTKIWADEPSIFSHYADDINSNGTTALRRGHLVVTPTKAGRFSFVIEFFGTDVGWLGKKQFDVTIVKGP